jgi:CelD/BcsL family acetyltransferase involved in cellulose biosynthesis
VPGLSAEVISDAAGLAAIAAEWRALQALSGASAVFQSFAQVSAWARHFAGEKSGLALHVVVVREAGRAVLILPLALSGVPLLRIARIAGDPVAQYSDAIAHPGCTPTAFEAALATLRQAGVDALILRGLRDDSLLLRFVTPCASETERGAAPYADLSGAADFPSDLNTLSKNLRKALRHRRGHLEHAGAHAFDILRGAEARAAVAEALDLKRKWMVQRGNLSTAFIDPATKDCLLELAENSESGATVARLAIGGETAAIRFGFEYRGTHFAYMSAYDARFAGVSPGKLLMEHCVSGFWSRGVSRLDMLPPEGRHKRDWCKQTIGVATYTLPLSRTGRAYADVYQARVRPRLKRAFEHMPGAVRSLIAALVVTI